LVVRAVLLFVLAIVSVLFSTLTLEQVLIKDALKEESRYFWTEYSKDPNFPAPNTWNLKSYLIKVDEDNGELLNHMGSLQLGFTRLKEQPGYTLLHKSEYENKQLLLIFDGENVRALALFLGIIPLT
jgi:hypothetical protein